MQEHDAERLEVLRDYGILDTPTERDFDELADLAATLCGTPVALVSLVDEHRQWFKASRGVDMRETPLSQSVCACVMHEPGPLQIPDLREDSRSRTNTLVTDGPFFRFYAGAPLRTADGFVLGMLCVLDYQPRSLTDVQLQALGVLSRQVVAQLEARRRAALLARHAEEHQFILDHVLAGLVVHGPDGSLLFANDLACSFLGLTREQLAGKTPADPAWRFLRADGSTMPLEEYPVLRAMRERQAIRNLVVGVVRGVDASPVWGLAHAYPRLDPQGRPDRIVVSFADITSLKQLEEQLRLADRRKDEFLATLSHELRNPLAPIRNAADLLGSGRASPTQAQWCQQVIARQAMHMSLLLDDLLDVSRISSGKLQLRPQEVPLQELVNAASEMALPLIQRKRHDFGVTLPEHPVTLLVDKVRMAQVLGNLLTNAAKYTDPGGRVGLVAAVESGEVQVHVEDNGVGLTPTEIEQVFNMFGQATSSEGRSEGGLGIGLALARGIVGLHGGSLTAESAGPGRGSRFTVRLPSSAIVAAAVPEPPA